MAEQSVSILSTARWPHEAEQALAACGEVSFFDAAESGMPSQAASGSAELAACLSQHDIIAATVNDRFDAAVFSAASQRGEIRTRLIANYGVGVNHIDLDAAKLHGIVVTNTPGVLTDATADLALTLILMTMRRAGEGERELRAGAWQGWKPTHMLGRCVSGGGAEPPVLGIIGMGRIGKAVARRAAAGFGMRVIYFNRSQVLAADLAGLPAEAMDSIEALCQAADIVSLHCPGGAETRHLIDSAALQALGPNGVLINTARGDVIDEEALIRALHDGQIGGAGLDVFAHEPIVPEGLLKAPNTVLLPHLGSATRETRIAMGMKVVENIRAFLGGEDPPDQLIPKC